MLSALRLMSLIQDISKKLEELEVLTVALLKFGVSLKTDQTLLLCLKRAIYTRFYNNAL